MVKKGGYEKIWTVTRYILSVEKIKLQSVLMQQKLNLNLNTLYSVLRCAKWLRRRSRTRVTSTQMPASTRTPRTTASVPDVLTSTADSSFRSHSSCSTCSTGPTIWVSTKLVPLILTENWLHWSRRKSDIAWFWRKRSFVHWQEIPIFFRYSPDTSFRQTPRNRRSMNLSKPDFNRFR